MMLRESGIAGILIYLIKISQRGFSLMHVVCIDIVWSVTQEKVKCSVTEFNPAGTLTHVTTFFLIHLDPTKENIS